MRTLLALAATTLCVADAPAATNTAAVTAAAPATSSSPVDAEAGLPSYAAELSFDRSATSLTHPTTPGLESSGPVPLGQDDGAPKERKRSHFATGRVVAGVGQGYLNSTDWVGDTDTPIVFGLQYTSADRGGWGIEVAANLGLAQDTVSSQKTTTSQWSFALGLQKDFYTFSDLHLAVGAGVAHVIAAEDIEDVSDDADGSFAGYGHAEVYWLFDEHISVGVDARYLGGTTLTINDRSVDADGWQWMLRAGYAF